MRPALVGGVVFAVALVALPVRATYASRTAADEPQYLLTALSLWEDGDLDIADELRDERWRAFHEGTLPEQTEALADGRRLSPHDPLLPLLLAVPVGVGGWVGAKVALAALAGTLAAVVAATAERRFGVRRRTATVTALAVGVSPPLVAYGNQVYPELPAALAVAVAVWAATGPLDRRGRWLAGAAIVALPWLAVKYVPVAAALALLVLLRLRRDGSAPAALRAAGALAAAGAVYVVAHRVLYGGWTVYAAGDHFVGGELTVVGVEPDYLGRSRRLLGLLVDRGFGLAAWAPVWLLAVPALAALARRRPAGWAILVLPLAAGWAVATWVALTMHGWWWPGRQVVVVLPLAALAVAWWADSALRRVQAVAVLGAAGLASWLWLVVEVLRLDRRLIIDFEGTTFPLVRAWRLALPELRSPTVGDWLRYVAWLAALGAAAVVAWRRAGVTPGGGTACGGVPGDPTRLLPPTDTRSSTHERTPHHGDDPAPHGPPDRDADRSLDAAPAR